MKYESIASDKSHWKTKTKQNHIALKVVTVQVKGESGPKGCNVYLGITRISVLEFPFRVCLCFQVLPFQAYKK